MASTRSLSASEVAYVQKLRSGSSRHRRRLFSASVSGASDVGGVSFAVNGQTRSFVLSDGSTAMVSGCIALLSGCSEASAKPQADAPRARLDQFFSVAAVFG